MQDVSTLKTTQDGRPAGVLYYFSAQDARERANALSKALENIGIIGASLKPKYVAAHVPTNPSYIGVILTSKNEQDIRDLVCSRLGLAAPVDLYKSNAKNS